MPFHLQLYDAGIVMNMIFIINHFVSELLYYMFMLFKMESAQIQRRAHFLQVISVGIPPTVSILQTYQDKDCRASFSITITWEHRNGWYAYFSAAEYLGQPVFQ
jgi:hypothetical protein